VRVRQRGLRRLAVKPLPRAQPAYHGMASAPHPSDIELYN